MARRWFAPLVLAVMVGAAAGVFGQAHPQTIDTIFKDFATDQSPGCAIGAARGDAPLAAKAYGIADLEHNVPLTPQSVFYMASVSKQFRLCRFCSSSVTEAATRGPRSDLPAGTARPCGRHHDQTAAPSHKRSA